jgi:hypothetical protein
MSPAGTVPQYQKCARISSSEPNVSVANDLKYKMLMLINYSIDFPAKLVIVLSGYISFAC